MKRPVPRDGWGDLKTKTAERNLKYSQGRYMVAHGLPHVRMGRVILVCDSDIDSWLEDRLEVMNDDAEIVTFRRREVGRRR